jgi:hypothetical protein
VTRAVDGLGLLGAHGRTWIDVYLVFIDTPAGDGPGWWRAITHSGFRHVFVMRRLGLLGEARVWQTEHVWHCGTTTSVVFLPADYDLPRELVREGSRVVRVSRWDQPRFRMRGLLTCVVHAKLAAGVGRWWEQRPRDLYRRLVREGYPEL